MAEDQDSAGGRVPTLVSMCQRVILKRIESFEGFGDVPFELYEPLLQECPAETLVRLEEYTPDLRTRTQHCWRRICNREYPRFSDMIEGGELEPPSCWREHFYHLKEWHQQRLEAVGERMREQRQAAEVQKKERQTVFVEPIIRKMRTQKPTTLLGKARQDTIRFQKTVYGSNSNSLGQLHKVRKPATSLSLGPSRSIHSPQSSPPPTKRSKLSNSHQSSPPPPSTTPAEELSLASCGPPGKIRQLSPSKSTSPPTELSTPKAVKKNPMSVLFLPKRPPQPSKAPPIAQQ